MYTVGDFMTRKLVTLNEDDDLALADAMLELGEIHHLPVVRGQKLVGIVSQRDVLRACGGRTLAQARGVLAREVMTREIVTLRPSSPLRRAAILMRKRRIGCVPIVEEDGTLRGIVTGSDLVQFAAEVLTNLQELELAGARRMTH